ncbi:hypothetical protein [Nonomuraea sp. NPDC046570]|uniref:hypothetical protein n=1 Tax=Nonomuraea sp. NPDC046570 TaxID=3155255 RepID=UPI0034049EFC
MLRRSLAALAALVVLSGCGTGTGAREPALPSPGRDNKQLIEAAKADCMKGKGFKYVSFVMVGTDMGIDEKIWLGDYAAMKADRTKRGYGVFYLLVHREKMRAAADETPDNPNYALRAELSNSQAKTYDKALESCEAQAIKQVTGKVVKSNEDWSSQASKAGARRIERELNGDPELAKLAAAMGDCLAAKGHQVTANSPRAMSEWGYTLFRRQLHDLAREQDDEIPPYDPDSEMWYSPGRLSAEDARRHLDREIKVALEDLECGKNFYAAYLPRSEKIYKEVRAEFGLGD